MTVSVDIETIVDRPPAEVFAALIDVERYPEWLIASGIVGVERLDPGPLAKGSRLRIRQTVAGRSTVLDGSVTVDRGGAGMAFGPGTAIWFAEGGDWAVRVERDAALLLSIGWPGTAEPA